MQGGRAIAAAVVFAVAPSNAAAIEQKALSPRRAPPRAGLTLWIDGGVGTIVPIPAGAGGGLSLSYAFANQARAGMFGHCTGASGGSPDAEAGEAAKTPHRAGLLCDLGLAFGWHGTQRPVAPAVEIGLGWGFVRLIDRSRGAGKYAGTGAVLSAGAGARVGERYEVMLRADVPFFRAALEPGSGDTLYGMSLVGEFGFRIF
jgi:hypothetical protein